jgi:glyoxylase-like metal-dependent hydrolase (beta-lactamase superfamily II)
LACLHFGAQAADPGLRAVQVSDGVWFFQGAAALGSTANRNFISNAGFVVTDGGVVVVDALGSPVLAAEMLAEIRRVTDQPLRFVIVTHYHADHIYGLQVLKDAGATIVAHGAAGEYLHSDAARKRLADSRQLMAPWVNQDTYLVAADRWLTGDETRLRVGSYDVLIRHAGPAHTPEDLVVSVPRLGVLFTGDLVFNGRLPFVGQADSRRWIAALDRLIADPPRLVIPGHGPVSTDALAGMVLTRDYLRFLRSAMGEAARKLEPFEQAYVATDWSRFEALPMFGAANRMNAFNTYLLMEQHGEHQGEQQGEQQGGQATKP